MNEKTHITITQEGDRIAVATPYHPTFVDDARALGGRWDRARRVWMFDARDAEHVAAVCERVFGINPLATEAPRLVTVRVKITTPIRAWRYFALGRVILTRPDRDSAVRPGPGCIIESGAFPPSGGSRAHPEIGAPVGGEPVVVLVRDVPEPLARRSRQGEIVEE